MKKRRENLVQRNSLKETQPRDNSISFYYRQRRLRVLGVILEEVGEYI